MTASPSRSPRKSPSLSLIFLSRSRRDDLTLLHIQRDSVDPSSSPSSWISIIMNTGTGALDFIHPLTSIRSLYGFRGGPLALGMRKASRAHPSGPSHYADFIGPAPPPLPTEDLREMSVHGRKVSLRLISQ